MKMWNGYCVPEGEITIETHNRARSCHHVGLECPICADCGNCVAYERNGVVEQYLKEQEMKMPELKSGMYLETTDGSRYIVINPQYYADSLEGVLEITKLIKGRNVGNIVYSGPVYFDKIAKIYNSVDHVISCSVNQFESPIWERESGDEKKLRELEDKAIAARKAVEEVEAEIKALLEE